jgi:hypothetical protein
MSDKTKQTRWMSSGYLQAAPVGDIDNDKGIIKGVSVCTVGEAKGHGVNLDREFIQRVTEFGNAKRSGLKARFGHPNMCSTALGTFIGRFKNFRTEGAQTLADLYLSNEAKNTPHGDLYGYVLGMATNEPDMFGTSIVFTPGQLYQRDDEGQKVLVADEFAADTDIPLYVECKELHACDTVDEPAANEGLFSRFSNETVAGQITEFLDLHPQVWDALQTNPSIIEALGRHGNKIDEFITRYREYRGASNEESEMTDETRDEQAEAAPEVVEELDATETPEATEPEAEAADAPEAEAPEQVEPESVDPEPEPETTDEPEAMSREQFVAVADEFGDDVAAQVMRDGGTVEDAARIAYQRTKDENEQLRKRVAELETARPSGTPAKASELKETKPLIRIQGRR